MPVKVFNQTYGRDEEKVFGDNTSRSFESIEVPSVEEFGELNVRLDWLQREQTDLRQWHEKLTAALQSQAERMLDRQHADGVVAELKAAISDTTVFTQALYAALDEHDQRILNSYVQTRQEIAELQQKSHVSALAAQSHLEAIQVQSTAISQGLKLQTELNAQARQEFSELQHKSQVSEHAMQEHLDAIQSQSTAISQGLKLQTELNAQARQEFAELQHKSQVSEHAAQEHLDAIQGQSTAISQGLKLQTELNAQARQEFVELQEQSHTAALAVQGHLDDFHSKNAAIAQSQATLQAELKVILTLAQQTQAELQAKAADAAAINQWQAWSAQMRQGGFWARLLWLFRGNPPAPQNSQNT